MYTQRELVRVDTENTSTANQSTRLRSTCVQYIFENQLLDNFALHPYCRYLDNETSFRFYTIPMDATSIYAVRAVAYCIDVDSKK